MFPTPNRAPPHLDHKQLLAGVQPAIRPAAQQVLLGPVPGVKSAGLAPAVADERHTATARAAAGRRRPCRTRLGLRRLLHPAVQAWRDVLIRRGCAGRWMDDALQGLLGAESSSSGGPEAAAVAAAAAAAARLLGAPCSPANTCNG